MPGFITHLALGEASIHFIDSKVINNTIEAHRKIFNLGLEGPDIFFYHIPAYLFFKHNIGNVMHSNNSMAYIDTLIDNRNRFDSEFEREICDAYIMGFIGHYTLDVFCHPYIYYKSDHWNNLSNHNAKFDFGKHVSLETDIDHIMLEKYYNCLPSDFNYSASIKPLAEELKVVSILISNTIRSTFPEYNISSHRVRRAIISMINLNKAMKDPKGNKKRRLNKLEHLFFKCDFISSMVPSNMMLKYEDPCNDRHIQWYNPWDKSLVSTDSFFDLFHQATTDFLCKLDVYSKSIDSNLDDEVKETQELLHYRNKLLSLLSDLSYLNGLPLKEPFAN